MAEIINFKEARDEQEEVFAIRQDDGELKPMEEWSGEDWKNLFEGPMTIMAQQANSTPWDMFAMFMSSVLNESLPEADD